MAVLLYSVTMTISYIAEIRTEAVMQALAAHDKRVPVMPLPSKRTSVNYHGQQQRQRDSRHGNLGQNFFKLIYGKLLKMNGLRGEIKIR